MRIRRTIAEELAALEALDRASLLARWARVFRRPAPKHMSRDLLLRILAYHLQEQAEGGLSAATRRRLAKLAGLRKGDGAAPPPPAPRLRPGARLIREWRGETHQVTVLEDGFDYRGHRYRSLSQVARLITGTRWSGPVFFGLRCGRASRGAGDAG